VVQPSTYRASIVIGGAVLAAMAVWAVARVAGIDFELKERASMDTVGPVAVIVTTVVAGLAAWGVYTLLFRAGHLRWWPAVGSAALATSTIGPNWYADGGDAVALLLMHLVVGVSLMLGLAWGMAESGLGSCFGWRRSADHG
jgi:hypothetical protein